MKDNIYYVYIFLDPRKKGAYCYDNIGISFLYEPFYIGKGKGRRNLDHFKPSYLSDNTYKSNKIKKILKSGLKPIVIKITEFINEIQAFLIEKEMISKIGRTNLKTGPLTNLDSGGYGSSGNILSSEAKKNISINSNKYWQNREMPKMIIDKIKESKRIHPQDYSYRYKEYKLISPENEIFIIGDGLGKFCDKNNLSRNHLVSVASGRRKTHKGWKCEYNDKNYKSFYSKTFKFISPENKEFITNDIRSFAKENNLIIKSLHSLLKGKISFHHGWKCQCLGTQLD